MTNRFRILSDEEGKRLDAFLADKLALPRTKIKDMLEEGHVRVPGKTPKPSLKIKRDMEIEGEIPEEKPLSLEPQRIPLHVLYEDDFFLAVDKPTGMVVHPSFGHREGTLVNAILAYLQESGHGPWAMDDGVNDDGLGDGSRLPQEKSVPRNPALATRNGAFSARPGIVHRLDKGTTGVILVAKDGRTQEMLSSLFKDRVVSKTYRAIVEGTVNTEEGLIEGSIGRHPVERKRMAVLRQGGRDAQTGFRVIERLEGYTYVEAYPKTGRTHQIRVHLAHIGHPVAGDETYGKKAKHAADRPLLHAYRIVFTHPIRGTPILIEAPVPDDMLDFISSHRGKLI